MTTATAGQTGIPIQAWRALADLVRRWSIAEFVVEGEPVAKERPRVTGRRTFTPTKTIEGEKAVAAAFRLACPEWEVDPESPFGVLAEFHVGTLHGIDGDNMLKLVLDALNGVFWRDDRQVAELHVRVERAMADPRTIVVLYPAAENRHTKLGTRRRARPAAPTAPAEEPISDDVRRRIYNFMVTEAMAGRAPSLTTIGAVADLTPLKTGDVIRSLESDGYLTRSPTRPHKLKIFKPFPRESST